MWPISPPAPGACHELAAHHHAAAAAGAEGDEHEVLHAARGARPHLAEGRGVCVVHEGSGRAREGGLDGADEAVGVKLDVGEEPHGAVVCDGAGDVEADADDVAGLGVLELEQLGEAVGDQLERLLAHKGGGGDLALGEELALQREYARLDARASDVDAENVVHLCALLACEAKRGYPMAKEDDQQPSVAACGKPERHARSAEPWRPTAA